MVGILAANSTGKAAAILEARDPAAALDLNEKRWAQLPDDFGGGIVPKRDPKDKTLMAIGENEGLMRDLGVQGTPALIYVDSHQAMHVIQSAPEPGRLAEIVSEAGGG
jgi:thiol:disulfide interchange protein DsbG